MRKSNQQSIGEVISQFLKEHQLDKKLKRNMVISEWEQIMGKVIANHTRKVYFADRCLFIELDSPALRQELLLQKSSLIKKINQEAGEELINDMVLK